MATQVQNAKAILDALADAAGKAPRTNEQMVRIVENATKTWDSGLTNEQKAQNFNALIGKWLRQVVRNNARLHKEAENDADVDAAGDSAAGDL